MTVIRTVCFYNIQFASWTVNIYLDAILEAMLNKVAMNTGLWCRYLFEMRKPLKLNIFNIANNYVVLCTLTKPTPFH